MATEAEHLMQIATLRGQTMGAIQDCHACHLRTDDIRPVPFRGPAPSPWMILTEAPGMTEVKYGKPLLGAVGFWLKQAFSDLNLPDLGQWFIANAVCCPPEGDHPVPADLHSCVAHLRAQVRLADPRWILTLGAPSLAATGVTAKVTQVHGRPFFMPAGPFANRWIFPTFHPMIVQRDESKSPVVLADLDILGRLLSGRMDPSEVALVVGRNGRLRPPE